MPAKSPSLRHQFRLGTLSEDLDKLLEHMRDYNGDHHALRRINRDTFRLDSELGTELIAAATVRHYMDYHLALCAEDNNPSVAPANYDKFADIMNSLDGSGLGWARLDDLGAITWDDSLDPADPETFCILDHDINPRTYLRAGEVVITHVELLDYRRLKEAETKSNVKWRMKRVDEKAQKEKEAGGLVKVSLDMFAKKRKRLQRSVDELAAMNSKKPRVEEELEDGKTLEPPVN
ncbi:hypothetical protein B0H13DRAFT_1914972 [Mycena leptocephala]|nr:hypothetical protein B0H13DRAFT_1914972 [Mycena leptocephala]